MRGRKYEYLRLIHNGKIKEKSRFTERKFHGSEISEAAEKK